MRNELTTIVNVELGDRSYPIYIGSGLLESALDQLVTKHVDTRRAVVITNPTVKDYYLDALAQATDWQLDVFTMPDGEAHKDLASYGDAMDFLMAHRHTRDTCILALGGGVVGDLAGFVAATYLRGVDFVQIPTTLLAQVDSSVGGKTAVNHPAGKNMIGAFYQPRCVVMDLDVLKTLPRREYAAGLAEIVKYGVIWDAELFAFLEDHAEALLAQDRQCLAHVIQRSCEIKAQVVAQDEREGGLRAILNFGHTFGHAIENLAGYGAWLHGEAVAMGMVMAAHYSAALGYIDDAAVSRITGLLEKMQLPTTLQSEVRVVEMIDAMGMDKKAVGKHLRFIVATGIGNVKLHTTKPTDEHLLATLKKFTAAVA